MNLSNALAWFKGLSRPNPSRDWKLVAGFAAVVGVIGVGAAAYLFWSVQTGSIVSAGAAAPRAPTPVSRELMVTVITSYQARAANYAARNFAAFTLGDPRPTTKKK